MLSRLLIVVSLLFLNACGSNPELPQVPNFSSSQNWQIDDAKKMAQHFANQKCTFAGYKNTGEDDAGVYLLDCELGQYEMYVTSSHLFESHFTWKVGEPAKFRFSEKLLLKPGYEDVRKIRELNATYYLEPLGTKAIPPPPPPPQ